MLDATIRATKEPPLTTPDPGTSPVRAPARNRFGFGIGTLGRDMTYTLVSMFLLFYLSDVLEVSAGVLAAVTVVLVIARVFDAVNDPFMGVIVDNTRSRWGKFKPWIFSGAVLSAVFLVLMFTDFGLNDAAFIVVFTVVYLAWEITFTANDIGYWSMLPALTRDQRERERIGAFARICANVGAFATVVAIVPVSNALADATGDMRTAYMLIALIAAGLMLIFQFLMLVLVKQDPEIEAEPTEPTRFRDLISLIFRNDQLLAVTVSLLLFTTGFTITIGFGLFYFKYVFGDEDMYSIFALVLGVAQITALALYPLISKRLTRRTLYTWALVAVVVGYVLFLFVPPGGIVLIVVCGLLVFAAQAVIQLLMLMLIADTVEYGQWKFGRRNDSVTLSLQPFIQKMGAAVSNGVIGWTVIASGMQAADSAADMTEGGTTLVKISMFLVPLVLIALSYVVYRIWYRLDEARYAAIVDELRERETDYIPRGDAFVEGTMQPMIPTVEKTTKDADD